MTAELPDDFIQDTDAATDRVVPGPGVEAAIASGADASGATELEEESNAEADAVVEDENNPV